MRDAAVIGHDEQHAVLGVQPADDPAMGALEYLDDLRHRPAALVVAGDAHRGAVAVQHLAHLLGRNEQIRAARVGREIAVPVGMADDAARDQVELLRDQQMPGAVLHHFAGALQLGERRVERGPFAFLQLELGNQFVQRNRRRRAPQRITDLVRVSVRERRRRGHDARRGNRRGFALALAEQRRTLPAIAGRMAGDGGFFFDTLSFRH